MTIELFTTLDDANVVGKTLHSRASFEGTLREETSLTHPVITITTEDTLVQVNYAYIPDFHRYYFVEEIVFVRNHVFRLSCRVDVLESFKSDILDLEGIISRNEKQYDVMLADTVVKTRQNRRRLRRKFSPEPEFNPQFVVIGSGGSVYEPVTATEAEKVVIPETINGLKRTGSPTIVKVDPDNMPPDPLEEFRKKLK